MTRSWWGWGEVEHALDGAELRDLVALAAGLFAGDAPALRAPPAIDAAVAEVAAPRVTAPAALADVVTGAPTERLARASGQGFLDVVRWFEGPRPRPPDLVARPRDAAEVAAVLDWVSDSGAVAVPVGGATSVVGGIEVTDDDRPVVAVDLARTAGLLDLDTTSRAAHLGAGTTGPQVEEALRPHGLSLRFYPQSFTHSTVGGWIATRAGGHFATGATHVDDLVESVAAVTPSGRWTSRRLPASGAGPDPDRLLLGSEGAFGVITDAWLRVRPRPVHRASATVHHATTSAALDAVRAVVQAGLRPANLRLLDPTEAALNGAGDGSHAVIAVGCESAHLPQGAALADVLDVLRAHGGAVVDGPHVVSGDRSGTAAGGSGRWRSAFLRAPYRRDVLVRCGAVVETLETAVTWDRAEELCALLRARLQAVVDDACGGGIVGLRVTHAYPDGCAPYVTVVAPGRAGARAAQWRAVKAAADEVIDALGATATHHHAVGRWHLPVHEREVAGPARAALVAVKEAVDPRRVCNPGVLGL